MEVVGYIFFAVYLIEPFLLMKWFCPIFKWAVPFCHRKIPIAKAVTISDLAETCQEYSKKHGRYGSGLITRQFSDSELAFRYSFFDVERIPMTHGMISIQDEGKAIKVAGKWGWAYIFLVLILLYLIATSGYKEAIVAGVIVFAVVYVTTRRVDAISMMIKQRFS